MIQLGATRRKAHPGVLPESAILRATPQPLDQCRSRGREERW